MSQLSSGGRKTRIKTKKINKTLWFLVIFAILCVIATIICIFTTLNSRKNGETSLLESLTNKVESAEKMSLGDKAWTNGLEIENIELKEEPIIDPNMIIMESEPDYKYEINYEKISGLRNKEIQDKINNEIEEYVLSLKTKLDEHSECDQIYITASVVANFSDVLSVNIYYSLLDNEDRSGDNNVYVNTGLNYRLDTGEKLKFEDLFRKDASIKQVLSSALYKAFAWQHAYSEDVDMTNNFNKTDYGYIENQTFKALAEYNKNPDIDFYFYPNMIYGIIRDFQFPIDMSKFSNSIAIYTKYVSDDKLYESSSLKKEFYAFTDMYLIDAFEAEGLKGDNFYYEIIRYPENEEGVNAEVKAVAQAKVDERLAHYFEIAKQNPDKAYMVSVMYYCDSKNSSSQGYQYNGYVAELDLDYFRKSMSEIVAKSRLQGRGDIGSYDYSMLDEDIEFYEEFSAYVDDYMKEEIEENITTKEQRKQEELEWEEERRRWAEEYGEE